jgi:hypothetical protein
VRWPPIPPPQYAAGELIVEIDRTFRGVDDREERRKLWAMIEYMFREHGRLTGMVCPKCGQTYSGGFLIDFSCREGDCPLRAQWLQPWTSLDPRRKCILVAAFIFVIIFLAWVGHH